MNRGDDEERCDQSANAAAYLLRALEPPEAEHYREHQAVCTFCRDELARLQPIVELLPIIAPPVPAPAELRHRVMSIVHAEAASLKKTRAHADRPESLRRAWRVRSTALAVTAAAAAGLVIGGLVFAVRSPGQTVIRARISAGLPGARAELRTNGARGELVVSGFPAPAAGKVYQVWTDRPKQPPQPTDALFTVTRAGHASIDVPGSLHGVGRVMVTTEPLGGSSHPTSAPVITVTLKPRPS